MNSPSMVLASGLSGTGTIGSPTALSSATMSASDSPATGPGFQSTFMARIASMHCPNVLARTATPVSTMRDVLDPGHLEDRATCC